MVRPENDAAGILTGASAQRMTEVFEDQIPRVEHGYVFRQPGQCIRIGEKGYGYIDNNERRRKGSDPDAG